MLLGQVLGGVRDGAWLIELLNCVVDTDLKRKLIGQQQAILRKGVTNGANRPRNARFPAFLVPLVDQSLDRFPRRRIDVRDCVRLEHNKLQGWALAETEKSDPRVGLLPYISLRVVVSFGSGSTSRLRRRKRNNGIHRQLQGAM